MEVPPTTTLAEPENDPPVEGFKVERPRCPHGGAFPVFVLADTVPDMPGAAFFDLDRTLLRGASGPVLSNALRSAGIGGAKAIPGESLVYRLFNLVGENLPAMALARQGPRLAKGRMADAVRAAAGDAAHHLHGALQPFAPRLFAEHRAAGRPLVLATTTPDDLVRPFAELLGFDDVVATRYRTAADGTYDGTLEGPFVWAAGKLAAVKEWAARHDVALDESYAYSDSVYDTPLLAAVGHPVVVNPDPSMIVMAFARRWPTIHLDVPPGVPKFLGVEPQQVAMALARPALFPYARFDIAGTERIPPLGPGIIVANHRSYFDATAMGLAIARSGRTVRFLGKKEVFDAPVIGQLATAMGGIRVERGTGSDEPLKAAAEALEAGQLVAIMPQGTIPRGPAFFDPKLKGRWGAARLAHMTKVPVIPVGLWGTEKVWPRSDLLPNVLNVMNPPTITVRVGRPVKLDYVDLDDDTKKIMKAIRRLLPEEARSEHVPTEAELRRTYPRGYKGDPTGETQRRPGTD